MRRTWCTTGPGADLLLKGGRVVDPALGLDAVTDVLIAGGKVAQVGAGLSAGTSTRVVDAAGMLVLPGFVDLHAHFREPGGEGAEDIASASRAGSAGGYVAAFGMANTDPTVDTAPVLRGLIERARATAVVPVGFFAAVTRGLKGERAHGDGASSAGPARWPSATTAGLWPRPRSRAAPCRTSRSAAASWRCTPRTTRS